MSAKYHLLMPRSAYMEWIRWRYQWSIRWSWIPAVRWMSKLNLHVIGQTYPSSWSIGVLPVCEEVDPRNLEKGTQSKHALYDWLYIPPQFQRLHHWHPQMVHPQGRSCHRIRYLMHNQWGSPRHYTKITYPKIPAAKYKIKKPADPISRSTWESHVSQYIKPRLRTYLSCCRYLG